MSKHEICSYVRAVLILIFAHAALAQSASEDQRAKPCREQPALIGRCFVVRGRLSLYNGAPTIRLWRAGTKRMLGVSGSYAQAGYRSVPAEVEKQLSWETELWGEYLVCPFTLQRPGEMQMICIEAGKKIVVTPDVSILTGRAFSAGMDNFSMKGKPNSAPVE